MRKGKTMKILLNRSHGALNLSKAACHELGLPWDDAKSGSYLSSQGALTNAALGIDSPDPTACRYDPRVIAAIEKIGLEASAGRDAELLIVEIPEGIDWEIWDYDGKESVHEKHRFWPAERDFLVILRNEQT
jgi:hypothetical protein